jgi:UDP-N-acetylmuramoyl-L-alanyl-D-glutamate--2,6-diaminopimelate ligase
MKQLLSKFLSQNTKNKLHKVEAALFAARHGHPASKIKVIGVTGTKGKTTVCNMIASIFDAAGIKNAMETTINTKIGDTVTPHKVKDKWVTTPPASVLQKFLATAVKEKCEVAILEVTSQAIDQHRVHGIDFDLLVYTNLSHEHMEYHGNKENYLNAKLKVFRDNPKAIFVVNMDDVNWNRFYSLPAKEKYLYSTKKPVEHGVVARKILTSPADVIFTAAYDQGQVTVKLAMPGVFNVQNALASACAALALGVKPEIVKLGLENIKGVTGRMEAIKVSRAQDFTVIVDYAHNADSLKNVYETVKEGLGRTDGRLISVLGATGHRDKSKRPIMGALAGFYADLVIFTNEDPYDEDPMSIVEEVAEGIFKGGKKKHQWRLNRNYWKVLDREQAIKKALREARKNDVVVITGKGAEEVMAIGLHEFIPFSDRKIVRDELEKLFC